MNKKSITIHQAFYGEVSRAHSCIKQTLIDSELTSFLIAFTDRPAALQPGIQLLPYLSGSAFSKYYVFSKTFPDTNATRAGMVFTHVLILNLEDITHINSLEDIFIHFVNSIESKTNEIKEFEANITTIDSNVTNKLQPQFIQETISTYISGVAPLLFSGVANTFKAALQQIWNSPDSLSRKNIKFRASFTYADIENVRDLTIVSIQKEFLPKWQNKRIILGENQKIIEINRLAELLFLGYQQDNPFYHFLTELNVELRDVQRYAQFEIVFNNYVSLDNLEDSNILRQDIRTLAKISPNPENGKEIKEKFLLKLYSLIDNEKDYNIKALRNMEWSAFSDGEKNIRKVVSSFIYREIQKPLKEQLDPFSELIKLAVTDEVQNWWHETIQNAVITSFKEQNEITIQNIWKLIDISDKTLINILSIIKGIPDCDIILGKDILGGLKEETYNSLCNYAKVKKWYLLHAQILTQHLSIEDCVKRQIVLEEKLSLEDSIGVKYLVELLTSEQLILLTLELCDSKLITITSERIEKNELLLNKIDLSNSCWLKIWTSFVQKSKNVFTGLAGREKTFVFNIMDLILKGENINDMILTQIANSEFADLTDYKDRNKIWGVPILLSKEKFLAKTAQNILSNLVAGTVNASDLESQISEKITSDSSMTNFLSENRSNIDPVLTIFSCFDNLKDHFLADYVSYYKNPITEEQSKKLGNLVSRNRFNKTAKSIYEKAKYDSSFYLASLHCRDLVNLNWWEKIWSFGSRAPNNSNAAALVSLSTEDSVRDKLPIVIILTAIKEEYLAVREHLIHHVDADRNDTAYEAGLFVFKEREIAKVIIRECGAKNTNAAQETERAIQYFKPDMVLFVGIAGSRKPVDFNIGDVIFPEKVYYYEGGKSERDSFQARPDGTLMSYPLLEKAKKERKKDDWKILIKGTWNQEVKADIGIIASGEQVVEHYDSEIGKILQKHFNDTSAVEMEGFGFGNAANKQGRETNKILIGVVRGISDIIVKIKKVSKNRESRPVSSKKFASATASAFAFWLILKTYE